MNDIANIPSAASLRPFAAPAIWLRHEIDRLFDNLEEPARNVFNVSMRALAPNPALDLTEDEKGYHLAVELPGLDEKDVEITVADGVLTISGEKKEERESRSDGYLVSERRYGKFTRRLALPQDVDPAKINATFRRGVMNIAMVKDSSLAQRTRKIAIKAEKD